MEKLVTVLLPIYNGQRFITEMLNSIYSQDYRPLEIIITDDASTDKTSAMVCRWLKGKSRDDISFKYIRNEENRGLSGNISNAVRYIHGAYLFLADQDDVWKKNKISAQVGYLEKNDDCEMCVCDRSVINDKGKVVCESLMRYEHRTAQKRSYQDVLNRSICYSSNCLCLKTEHLDHIFPIPDKICEHDTFIAIMVAHYGKIGYIRKPLTMYRIHEDNLSGNYALETTPTLFKLFRVIIKNFRRINRREEIDPILIQEALKARFNEKNVQFSKALYPGRIEKLYFASFCYIWNNLDRWKRFI